MGPWALWYLYYFRLVLQGSCFQHALDRAFLSGVSYIGATPAHSSACRPSVECQGPCTATSSELRGRQFHARTLVETRARSFGEKG